jgi:hypothetical protein
LVDVSNEDRLYGSKDSGFVRFSPSLFSLESLSALHKDGRVGAAWPDPVSAAILMLLRALLRFHLGSRCGFSQVQMRGYSILEVEEFFHTLTNSWVEAQGLVKKNFANTTLPTNPTDLLETLRSSLGELWPMHLGPPIRLEGNLVCCDIYAATVHLMESLEFPSDTGEIANARGKHFETMVQNRIDQTPWRPEEDLRKYTGRTIQSEGHDVTNLDALAHYRDCLLLVSCKSKIYSARYDAGVFNVVRNHASAIEEAVEEWTRIVPAQRSGGRGG